MVYKNAANYVFEESARRALNLGVTKGSHALRVSSTAQNFKRGSCVLQQQSDAQCFRASLPVLKQQCDPEICGSSARPPGTPPKPLAKMHAWSLTSKIPLPHFRNKSLLPGATQSAPLEEADIMRILLPTMIFIFLQTRLQLPSSRYLCSWSLHPRLPPCLVRKRCGEKERGGVLPVPDMLQLGGWSLGTPRRCFSEAKVREEGRP